jgi:hypothetical protein
MKVATLIIWILLSAITLATLTGAIYLLYEFLKWVYTIVA